MSFLKRCDLLTRVVAGARSRYHRVSTALIICQRTFEFEKSERISSVHNNSVRMMASSIDETDCRVDKVTGLDDPVVTKDEVARFIGDCMMSAGTSREDAITVAHHLMTADYRGHFSHGMNRMHMYVNDIKSRTTDPTTQPQVVTDFQVSYRFSLSNRKKQMKISLPNFLHAKSSVSELHLLKTALRESISCGYQFFF